MSKITQIKKDFIKMCADRGYVFKDYGDDFYVCPNHIVTGGWESCCVCGGWADGEEERLCTEALNSNS